MAVTIKDVAVQTGLAISTISKYLNGGNVLPENRDKIKRAIDEIGFNANSFARGLKTNRSHLIGIVLDSLDDEWLMKITSALEGIFRRHGYACIIADCSRDEQKTVVDFMLSRNVDGIIFLPMQANAGDLEGYLGNKIPVVALLKKPEDADCDFITVDDYAAVYSAVRYLMGAGRRHIGYIGGIQKDAVAAERLRGYREALQNAHIPIEDTCIIHGDSTVESGYECMRKMLQLSNCPEAVLIGDNQATIGAMMAVLEERIQVPDRLSIIGFDNVMLAQCLNPCLSVIIHPVEKLASIAAQTMLDRLSGTAMKQIQICKLPSTFFIGNSV